MDKVSIIIPMHNEESYVRRLLSGVKDQTYKELEIIIIDDASTDKSLEIVKEIADERFLILENKSNSGVSAARNKGLDVATGKYVMFVDMDDIVKTELVEQLVFALTENEVQLAVCGYERFDESGQILGTHRDEKNCKPGKMSAYEFARDMIRQEGLKSSLWNKLYIKQLIDRQRFDESCAIGEDLLFNLEYASKIYSAVFFDDILYGYFENPKGAMKRVHNSEIFEEKWLSEWYMIKKYEKTLRNWPEIDYEAGRIIFYRKLIIAHKLYYKMQDCGVKEKYIKEAREMERLLFESDRKIVANKYINPKWKTKLFMKVR